ncbi:DUF3404 domain-containing protein [Vibrio neptunius]|uniref:histidine kinase n=1 Tax=Vibrio neptunius TaxID=170651 RepID=A0ABS3A2A3_9VIBR|nr:DUF3404 domain-containing protein [Vibrio neptunius]MBN3493647.1 DUF3404 domain-containing protein [Vibrio neptunius]MBN3516122.1 DUF3404 domain-containing protein [Vibrio neptunius]MBN3550414.1 DUF3404 domain-containing protein [Vibrio neptunius]MBN3578448.1 DUF3404 domain-containing protein [Vibrio neptunius]MCH9872112.1 DUF3404 domain-containing protein [Vibrio neptunius]
MRQYYLAMCFVTLFPLCSQAQSVQDKWQSLYQQSWQSADLSVSQQQLSRFPVELLKESARYPDFSHYSWPEIETVYKVSQTCRSEGSTAEHLKDAVEFELAMCRSQSLNPRWFTDRTLRHPAGGSFADRYLALQPDAEKAELLPFLTIGNVQHPLHYALSPLSGKGREALLNGYRAWMEKDRLWLSGEQGWKSIPAQTWQPLARKLNMTLSGPSCTLRYSNLCISEIPENILALRLFIAGLSLLTLLIATRGLHAKRRQSRERRFILQLLTHELRTPITSLGLTVEMFRHQFDHLPKSAQEAVWRLMSDHQRLAQLTENSKIYLSTQRSDQLMKQTAYVSDWLEHICQKYQLEYQLNQDRELTLPFYWLSICLDNLINNAKQHGQGKIQVNVILSRTLVIEVMDQGNFLSPMKRLIARTRLSTSGENMGIGLNIVEHLIKLMGGRLRIQRRPTRCTLELPL